MSRKLYTEQELDVLEFDELQRICDEFGLTVHHKVKKASTLKTKILNHQKALQQEEKDNDRATSANQNQDIERYGPPNVQFKPKVVFTEKKKKSNMVKHTYVNPATCLSKAYHAPKTSDEGEITVGVINLQWEDIACQKAANPRGTCETEWIIDDKRDIRGFTYMHFIEGTDEYNAFRSEALQPIASSTKTTKTTKTTQSQELITLSAQNRRMLKNCKGELKTKRDQANNMKSKNEMIFCIDDIDEIMEAGQCTRDQLVVIRNAAFGGISTLNNSQMNNNNNNNTNNNNNKNNTNNNNNNNNNNDEVIQKRKKKRKITWNCNACDRGFDKAKQLHAHQNQNHPDLVTEACPDCDKLFGQADLLTHHRKYSHTSRIKTGVTCPKEDCSGELLVARAWNPNALYGRWGVDMNKVFFNYMVCDKKKCQRFVKLSKFKELNPLNSIFTGGTELIYD